MNRGLVLGIDGLDFAFAKSNLDSLPTLRGLTERGTWGKLRSTIPPLTAPAWTTALSGMNPGKTGISNFVQGEPKEYSDHLVDSTDVQVPRMWDVVGANDGESVVIGAPITFPAAEIKDAMITGLRTPSLGDSAVHPTELAKEIPPEYEFFVSYSDFSPSESDDLLEKLYTSTDAKFDLLERVLAGDVTGAPADPSLVCFVLSESDWIQHYFLKHPEHPQYDRGEQTVREYFEHVDSRLADVLELSESRTVGILSDHGFGKRISKHVHVSEILRREGYLHLSEDRDTVRDFVGRHIRTVARVPGFRYLKDSIPKRAKQRAISMSELSDDDIDWDATVATFRMVGNNVGAVDLHVPEMAPHQRADTRDRIATAIADIVDPDTGESVTEEVYTADELYDGPSADEAADVTFLFREAYTGITHTGVDSVVREIPRGGRPGVCHRMDGFYAIAGDGVESGLRADTIITDFAPTFYQALGVPLPEDIDGSVLADAFEDPRPRSRRYDLNPTFKSITGDSEEVEERLENLGYL